MADWTEETNWEDAYAGAISFLRCKRADSAEDADIAIMGIPYDLGTSGRPGARFGPRAIREQSLAVGEFEWGVYPWPYEVRDVYRCVDIGDVTGFTAYPERLCPAVEKKAGAVLECDASLLSFGGDHFVSLPLLRTHAAKYGPLCLIHFDAHSDTWASEDVNHGTMFYHAIQEGLIDPEHSMQIGLRTPNPDSYGIEIWDANKCLDSTPQAVSDRVREKVGDRHAYLTFDIDCLDPSNAPATGTPVAGGVTLAWARRALQGLEGLKIVGGDHVEIAPHYDGPSQITALAGATIASDILYLIAAGRKAMGRKARGTQAGQG